MKDKKVQASFMNVGASSLLVIFIILCMAVFATLSLSSAKSDYSFSYQMGQRKTEYYTACNQAQLQLAKLHAFLMETAQTTENTQAFFEQAGKVSELSHLLTYSDRRVSFRIPVNDSQTLEVELALRSPHDTDSDQPIRELYTIEKWATVPVD